MLRIGYGYDVHRLVAGRKLILGGVEIPFDKGLEGHSDADVVLHSVIDALLGALSLGDIGSHFPDTDPQYEGIDSRILLQRTFSLVQTEGYVLNILDCTICEERPKLQPYLDKMRENLAKDLACDISQISLKATTEEGLGVSGNGGISSTCILLLRKK